MDKNPIIFRECQCQAELKEVYDITQNITTASLPQESDTMIVRNVKAMALLIRKLHAFIPEDQHVNLTESLKL